MRRWTTVADARIVRLNAELHPVTEYEGEQYTRFGLATARWWRRTPAEIIPHVAQADAVFAVSVTLPDPVIRAMAHCLVIARWGRASTKSA